MDYAQKQVGSTVPPACCDWLKSTFVEAGPSVDDKKNSCLCLKAALVDTTGLRDKRLKKIPGLCGVTLPFTLRKKPNCDRYVISTYTFVTRYHIFIDHKLCSFFLWFQHKKLMQEASHQ
ncbi:unnamed protein product [Linum tenue]|uniref:Bifunctional inhibitor/plant lipid transfer protein/seed storage helical domain-containing protein n=1 Tax=Linum tenue TaxID=586396 RepID=A0AAV0NQE9_9ROSI|nr:unnamed protein product [Linum tenue]